MSARTPVTRSISFNAAMLEAVRANRKTVTRRRLAAGLPLHEAPDAYLFGGMDADVARFEPRPSAAMPAALRITCPFGQPGDLLQVVEAPELVLEVCSVRAEQLQGITATEAQAEGLAASDGAAALAAFRTLIDSIYPSAWVRNEWVWVIGFRRVQ
ncbi:hypothetical protein [Hymenobacter cellulosivorans]|uniref:ASCH domain-containing protein n=1 Tax=Hymenobacter cellulosivorans TaxID=2932249 RepID=A0ABY4F6P5_9BACT|nr:hypothetical protein [Hymenobacter cellulosivorans]UOQ51584.1 hypothetical protein MUN80_17690 [Hymenobacter cellulosivorans]